MTDKTNGEKADDMMEMALDEVARSREDAEYGFEQHAEESPIGMALIATANVRAINAIVTAIGALDYRLAELMDRLEDVVDLASTPHAPTVTVASAKATNGNGRWTGKPGWVGPDGEVHEGDDCPFCQDNPCVCDG